MSDKVTAWLRTVVPAAWGSLVLWAVAQLPAIPESVQTWLMSDATVAVVLALSIGLWYWVWTKIEGYMPPWLTRIVLGSNKTPSYTPPVSLYEPYTAESGDPMVRVTTTGANGSVTEEHFTA